jgi:signal transduction histidine kinase
MYPSMGLVPQAEPKSVGQWEDAGVKDAEIAQSEAGAPDWTARVVDLLFYLGLGALLVACVLPRIVTGVPIPLAVGATVAAAASMFAVRLRRKQPMIIFSALVATAIMMTPISFDLVAVVLLPPGLFCLAAYDRRDWVRDWLVPGTVIALIALLLVSADQVLPILLGSVTLLSIVGWARGVRAQRLYREGLVARLAVVERENDLRAAQAVAAERARIARDIHDLVSHSLAIVALQAAGAERIADRDPGRVKEALGVISGTARDALTEMRGMLVVLRTPETGNPAADAPTPGLSDVPQLVGGLVAGGVLVQLDVRGEPYELAPGAELALYRVVQEALTNAVKYGDRSEAKVVVEYAAELVRVSVSNGLALSGQQTFGVSGSGSGQLGMRERLAIYGGSMTIEENDAIYCLVATLPRSDALLSSRLEHR